MLRLVGGGETLARASHDHESLGAPIPQIAPDAEAIQRRIMALLGERGRPFRRHITDGRTAERLLAVHEDVSRGAGLTPGRFIDHVETFTPAHPERIAGPGRGSGPGTSWPSTGRRRRVGRPTSARSSTSGSRWAWAGMRRGWPPTTRGSRCSGSPPA